MSAEFQLPSPLVPTRESYFVRYCELHPDGTWAVADASPDDIGPSLAMRCQKRPSGCLIQEMPDGYSKVNTYMNNNHHFLRLINSMHLKFTSLFGYSFSAYIYKKIL